jgi:predicted RNA-binding protein YlxR (DUF448 family)
MPGKSRTRAKHIPQRTCVGCRKVLPKRSLIRIVRTTDGVRIDPSGKLAGRGAYLHDQPSCWVVGLKGSLAHALKIEISKTDRLILEQFTQTLPGQSTRTGI